MIYLSLAKHHIHEGLNLQHKVSMHIIEVVKEWLQVSPVCVARSCKY